MEPVGHDVVGALLVRANRVLLCHRSPDREWFPDVWDVAGGHVEAGETRVAALARELHEELGVQATVPPDPIAVLADGDVRLSVWRIDTWTGTPKNASPDEHDRIAWFGVDDVADLPLAHPSYPALIATALAAPDGRS